MGTGGGVEKPVRIDVAAERRLSGVKLLLPSSGLWSEGESDTRCEGSPRCIHNNDEQLKMKRLWLTTHAKKIKSSRSAVMTSLGSADLRKSPRRGEVATLKRGDNPQQQ